MSKVAGLFLVGILGLATAQASTISIYGDADCFGIPGVTVCPDGSNWQTGLGGVFFTDYRSAAEILAGSVTDIWAAPANVTWQQPNYSTAGALSASLILHIAGIADGRGPWTVSVNGTSVGTIPFNGDVNNFQEVLTYAFAVPVGLLNGHDTILVGTDGGDGFSMDYSQLTIQTTSAVPEPATFVTILLSFAILGFVRFRRAHL